MLHPHAGRQSPISPQPKVQLHSSGQISGGMVNGRWVVAVGSMVTGVSGSFVSPF